MIGDLKDLELVQRLGIIRELCKGRSVLHLGCTNHPYTRQAIDAGMLLHTELAKVSREIYGFDGDREGIELLESGGTGNLFEADLENLGALDIERSFEVIVAGEIIEHLNNPGLFLDGVKRFMDPGSRLVITTVNTYCALRFVQYALRGKRGRAEPVHPDHVAYYSYRTLSLMLKRHGFVMQKFLFYDIGKEHRPHNPWHWNAVNDIAVRLSPHLSDGLIAICGLEDESN